jgi:hypothetical protein
MFFWQLQNFLKTALAAICTLLMVMIFCGVHATRFSAFEGERVFYVHTASSQGLRKESLQLCDLFSIKGESVRFTFEEETQEQLLEKILIKYGATVVFCERAADVTSYYAYTPQCKDTIVIDGVRVNLHIAFNKEICVLGSPIIFDGY